MAGLLRSLPPSLLGALALLSLSLAGCSTAEEDGDEDGAGISEDEAPQFGADLICDAWVDCDCENYDTRFDDEAECRQQVEAEIMGSIAGGQAAELTWDPSCLEVIEDIYAAVGCGDFVDLFLSADTDLLLGLEECKLYYGTAEEGDDCERVEDEDGDSIGDDCTAELVCGLQSGRCEPWPSDEQQDVGQPCTPQANECLAGLACVSVDGVDNTCEVLPSTGETCLGENNLCDFDNYCDLESKQCALQPGEGEACSPAPGNLGALRCESRLQCGPDDICIEGPGEGEDCLVTCTEGFTCEQVDAMTRICVESRPVACVFSEDDDA